MKIKIIITGATGMVGEGVLMECLAHPEVEKVLMVNRKHSSLQHPRLEELIVPDFFDLTNVKDKLAGYDVCLFCAGVSSLGMKEPEYHHVTYELTMHFAQTLVNINSEMIFDYVSGAQTDSTEKGKIMWARVKGKTENALMKLPFTKVYNFRPGFMKPTEGQKNINGFYKFITSLYPLFKILMPGQLLTMREVGSAMVNSVLKGYAKPVLEVKDIKALAR